jgi:hypothetical protein
LPIKGIIQKIQIHNTAKMTTKTEVNTPIIQLETIHVLNKIVITAIKVITDQTTLDQTITDNTMMKDVPVNTIPIQEITAQPDMVKTTEISTIIHNNPTTVATKITKDTITVSNHIGTDNSCGSNSILRPYYAEKQRYIIQIITVRLPSTFPRRGVLNILLIRMPYP